MGKIFIGEYDKISILMPMIQGKKLYVVGDEIGVTAEHHITFKESIMYKYYFPWLAEIDENTVLVLNNILKKQQRNALEYNCIRYYCQQAGNVIVFNDYPLIENIVDFEILYDMVQKDPFFKDHYEKYDKNIVVSNCRVRVKRDTIEFDEKIIEQYQKLKEETINAVRKDPDIIPRRLLKFAEKKKPKGYDKLTELKPKMHVCVSNLPVDRYFYSELARKVGEINGFTNIFEEKCS